jgi:hypothetical protein
MSQKLKTWGFYLTTPQGGIILSQIQAENMYAAQQLAESMYGKDKLKTGYWEIR